MRNLSPVLAAIGGAACLVAFALTSSVPVSGGTPAAAAAATYGVDLGHSNILFKCKHLGVSYQWGRFDAFGGSFTLSEEAAESSVEITVDAASVNSNDEKRDKHLRSADFFDAKQFPEMTFRSKKVVSKGEGVFSITGDLTLHGVTRSIVFDVTKVGEAATRMGDRAGFEGSFVIDRMDYGISAYGEMLGHDVHMHFAIEG
ncbi:MAG: YceI family protein, partial [Planctomycetota bacterium]|nr:YceI family protein [Planctomycetota bacterium]